MTTEGDAHWVTEVELPKYGIKPAEWTSRRGSFPTKGYCPCEMWLEQPHQLSIRKTPQQIVDLVIAFYFQGVSYLVKKDRIASTEQENHFNLMGVPRPVWQLLVAMIAKEATPDATG